MTYGVTSYQDGDEPIIGHILGLTSLCVCVGIMGSNYFNHTLIVFVIAHIILCDGASI